MEAALALRMTRSAYLALPAEDRAWHEALLAEKAEIHEPCGQPMTEAFDPKNWGRYTVDGGVKCNACLAIEQKSKGEDSGIYYSVHLRHD